MHLHLRIYLHDAFQWNNSQAAVLSFTCTWVFEEIWGGEKWATYLLGTVYMFGRLRVVDQISYPAKNAT